MDLRALDQQLIPSGTTIAKLIYLAKKHHVKLLVLFGSFAYGDTNEYSDLDIAYEFDPEHGPIPGEAWDELGAIVDLDIKVLAEVKPHIRYTISVEGICLHEYQEDYWDDYKETVAKEWEKYKPIYEKEWHEKITSGTPIPLDEVIRQLNIKNGEGP